MGARGTAAIAALIVIGLFSPRAKAADVVPEPPIPRPPPVSVNVILPDDYETSGRDYPVLYLLNTVWDTCAPANCGPFLDILRRQPFITVTEAESKYLGDYVDWRDHSHMYESDHVALVDWVDTRYRTKADRAGRAVAGTSAGGYGAMLLAAHHPDLFGTAASFSGIVDILGRGPASQAVFEVTGSDPAAGRFAVWGRPGVDDLGWHANNPSDLAGNLAATDIWHSVTLGAPCQPAETDPGLLIETLVRDTNATFDAALTAAGVEHTYSTTECGTHSAPYFLQQFEAWLPTLDFAPPTRPTARYRTTERAFNVDGWQFVVDPQRAEEFMAVDGLDAGGFTLTGSGRTAVVSAPVFEPGETVEVAAAGQTSAATADDAGRLHLTVDLGAPHTAAQYSPQAAVARSEPASVTVVLARL